MTGYMEASTVAIGTELGDRLGDVLADRFLYHFLVRRHALRLLGQDDGWGGLPVLPPASPSGALHIRPQTVAGTIPA